MGARNGHGRGGRKRTAWHAGAPERMEVRGRRTGDGAALGCRGTVGWRVNAVPGGGNRECGTEKASRERHDEERGLRMRTRPEGSGRPLCEEYDTALLDLDGVVYAGSGAIGHAVDSLAAARAAGMHLAYVTNNAARTPVTVAGHLAGLGIPAGPEDVITSAQAVARLVSEQVPPGSAVLVVGGDGLVSALTERGLRPVRSADDEPAAVVQGYSPKVGWEQLAEAAYAVNRGVPWFASNTDLTIPTARGTAPGNGALVQVVRIATGAEPRVAGKPQPPMHRETILRTGAKRALVVGDRLDTDIEGAYAGGVDSLLVLTGVTRAADLLAAPPHHRPTFVAEDLRGLLVAHPVVEEATGTGGTVAGGPVFRCGGWSASVSDGVLVLDGDAGAGEDGTDGDGTGADRAGGGERIDGLRALCAAAWAADARCDASGDAADSGGGGRGAYGTRGGGGAPDADKVLGELGY